MFRVKNNVFTKQLKIVIWEDKTTQAILKKINQGDVKKFAKKDKFLLF